jgi:hypothetical protein
MYIQQKQQAVLASTALCGDTNDNNNNNTHNVLIDLSFFFNIQNHANFVNGKMDGSATATFTDKNNDNMNIKSNIKNDIKNNMIDVVDDNNKIP